MGAGAPTITGINPTGHLPGTFTVTLTGTNFTGVTEVTCFGASNFTWNFVSDTQITVNATFPAGTYYLLCKTPDGTASSPTALTVTNAPVINYINPTQSPPGTFSVDIIGSNFTGVTDVTCSEITTFATISITWNFISDTQITVTGTFPIGNLHLHGDHPQRHCRKYLITAIPGGAIWGSQHLRRAGGPLYPEPLGATTTDGTSTPPSACPATITSPRLIPPAAPISISIIPPGPSACPN